MENLLIDKQLNITALGIDISKDYTLVGFMCDGMTEPDSMSIAKEEKRYLIPTCMYKMQNVNQWFIGEEAAFRAKDEGESGNYIDNFLDAVKNKGTYFIEEREYKAKELLGIYIELVIEKAREILNFHSVSHIAVTVEKTEKNITDTILGKLRIMGYKEENIRVINHTEAFIYYVINQKRELWVNDVVIFDFSNHHFKYRRLKTIKNRVPSILTVDEEDFSKLMDMTYISTDADKARLDEKFLSLVQEKFGKKIISSVFLTGVGFYDEWADKSIKEICTRRRVFKGYNLFVKGACYAALKRYMNITDTEYIFSCDGRTKANIGITIKHKDRHLSVLLSKAGSNWYEAGVKTECILDDTSKLEFIVSSVDNVVSEKVTVDLSAFPKRANKATRVEIVISYINDSSFEIIVKDLGFGDFFKASNMVVRKTVDVNEILG